MTTNDGWVSPEEVAALALAETLPPEQAAVVRALAVRAQGYKRARDTERENYARSLEKHGQARANERANLEAQVQAAKLAATAAKDRALSQFQSIISEKAEAVSRARRDLAAAQIATKAAQAETESIRLGLASIEARVQAARESRDEALHLLRWWVEIEDRETLSDEQYFTLQEQGLKRARTLLSRMDRLQAAESQGVPA